MNYIFKKSTIFKMEHSQEEVNEEAFFVDYAELPAFSSLPLCVKDLLIK